MSKLRRILVVGAGSAGLSAAWYLKQKGYQYVDVVEASDRVGGKCKSVKHEGLPYEVGAFTVTPGYRNVRKIARTFGVELEAQPPRHAFSMRRKQVMNIKDAMLKDFTFFTLFVSVVRYYWKLLRYRSALTKPGLSSTGSKQSYQELSQPFQAWLVENKMLGLQGLFRITITDMGYGRFSEIPTLYVLKYLNFWNFTTLLIYGSGFGKKMPKRFRHGFESLWQAVATSLNVSLKTEITSIQRGEKITVEMLKKGANPAHDKLETRLYDALIIACPPDRLADVMDFDQQEKSLVTRFKYSPYVVNIFKVSGMPNEVIGAINEEKIGDPKEIMKPWAQGEGAVAYSVQKGDLKDEEIIEKARQSITTLYRHYPVKVGEHFHTEKWQYFPHVSSQDIGKDDFYGKFEEMQGQKGTYYTGSYLSFETVELAVSYSKQLIKRYF
ncbi:flavin monoamine oxidase family protein [Litoribacillus peritrichatus]|uniref:Amine oxidase domain-containing protein n=1 Tax=Litoribacillus peritrichatus TaxID=718191 RepID=A0ABP7MSN6_9GAMM